jgi:hypothetical protein
MLSVKTDETRLGRKKKLPPESNSTDESGKVTKLTIDEALQAVERLTAENKALTDKVAATEKQLKTSTDILLAQTRARLTQRLRQLSIFAPEQIEKMPIEEMQIRVDDLENSKIPRKNINFVGATDADPNEGLTVGNQFDEKWGSKKGAK